eukprot:scaffold6.g2565.t1
MWASLMLRMGRRVPRKGYSQLSPKQGPRGYYKGKGAASTGRHAGQTYRIQEEKLPQYVVPDLSGFQPYVAYELPKK